MTHVARLPVCAGGKGNGGKARHQVNFNHAPVDDDENHDIQSRHGKLHEERLQENTEERPQFHGFKLGLHIIQYIRRDGGGALYQARRLLDDLLGHIKHRHDDIEGVGQNQHRHEGLENPFEENPCIEVV